MQYSPKEIEHLTVNGEKKDKLCEPVGNRGDGSIIYKQQCTEVEAYYRYRNKGKDRTIFIGQYVPFGKKGYNLTQIRDKAREYARLRKEIAPADLKEYLELEQARKEQEIADQKKQAEIEASKGTLEELCQSYVGSLKRRNASSAKDVESCLHYNLIKPFPHLVKRKANTITPDDLMPVCQKILARGVTTNFNRFRSYLMAAFNQGMKSDYDPRQQLENGKRFAIQFNPVDAIPKYAEYERVRERSLSNDEIHLLWHNHRKGKEGWNPLYGLLLQFCLACYGNRPEQMSEVKWADINKDQRTLRFIDTKGKNARPKKRIIPLTKRALDILEAASEISGQFNGPFCITGKATINVSNLSTFVGAYNDWVEKTAATEGRQTPERFTAKDLRRTATRLFTDCRVLKEHRYLLQSRQDGSVESRHYDHDDRLPEKRDVAKIYDDYLGRIIDAAVNEQSDNVIQLKSAKPSVAEAL